MPCPEVVIFDIGNVLIEWRPERFYDSIMPTAERKRMFAEVDLHAMNDRIDRGGNFRQVIQQTADTTPEFRDQILLWHDNWLDLATPAIDRSVNLSRALRAKNIPTCILSNIGRETYALAEGKYPFLAEFNTHFLSGHMETIKPEGEIYQQVEETLASSPDRFLFADDRQDNLDVAQARGWQTHLFTTPEGWAQALVDCGLLTRKEAGITPA